MIARQQGLGEISGILTLGAEYLGMTCTVITMMHDGLCQKNQLKIKTN